MILVGFYGQFQGPFIYSIVFLGPMPRADGYIYETWLFVTWCPQGDGKAPAMDPARWL